MQDRADIAVRDRLAKQRTELANERTLLAYVRTALGFIVVGVPAIWWLEGRIIQSLGVVSLVAGAACLGIGIRRFITIKASLHQQPD